MNNNLHIEIDNLKQKYSGSKLKEAKELLFDFIEKYPQFDNTTFKILIGQFVEDENATPVDTLFVHIIHPNEYNRNLIPSYFGNYKVINWSINTYMEIES